MKIFSTFLVLVSCGFPGALIAQEKLIHEHFNRASKTSQTIEGNSRTQPQIGVTGRWRLVYAGEVHPDSGIVASISERGPGDKVLRIEQFGFPAERLPKTNVRVDCYNQSIPLASGVKHRVIFQGRSIGSEGVVELLVQPRLSETNTASGNARKLEVFEMGPTWALAGMEFIMPSGADVINLSFALKDASGVYVDGIIEIDNLTIFAYQ